MGTIRIGISGWRYAPWRGVFYPPDLPQRRELEYASRALPTIEINGSFYCLQRPEFYAEWHEQTPAGFVFSVKGGRYITHIRRLRDVETALANFFASGILNLREKLGPVLWQFPATFRWDPERFSAFFALLPRDTQAALALARRRDARMHGRSRLAIDSNRPLRHAVEIRHGSFRNPEFVALLRRHNVALVVADTAGKWPLVEDVTADFVYVRLHGEEELYASGYTDSSLDSWAARLRAWSNGSEPGDARVIAAARARRRRSRDVYCYFDNDIKVKAPFDAQRLMARLDLHPVPAPMHGPEPGSVPPLRPWPAPGKARTAIARGER
jgi:uncharacterized protein YecE (DUF72 family)